MKLRFLGQTYSTSFKQIDTKASEQTGCFLGQKYKLRLPIATSRQQLGIRKYRGVVYGLD